MPLPVTPAPAAAPPASTDFLSTLVLGTDVMPVSASVDTRSEEQKWISGDGGPGDLHFPLKWWKVRCLSLLSYVNSHIVESGSQS